MITKEEEKEFVTIIAESFLDYEEAQVYFTLVKQGTKGTIVKELTEELSPLKRTTIYSILNRLIEKECVKEGGRSNTTKRAKLFVAIKPSKVLRAFLIREKRKLKKLEEIELMYSDRLDNVYNKGIQLTQEDLHPFISSYLRPLIKNNWKVLSQNYFEGKETYGYDVFDYELKTPSRHLFLKGGGMVVFVFDRKIEQDKSTIEFSMTQLKRKGKADIMRDGTFKEINMKDGFTEICGHTFPAIILEGMFKRKKSFEQVGQTIVIPIKNKIFFVWSEDGKYEKEIVRTVLDNEKIPIIE